MLVDESDLFYLTDDMPHEEEASRTRPWTVAVIDDDWAVHEATRFALRDYRLDGRGLEILTAASAAEGRRLVTERPDIAVILLDVVMERDDAGLSLVDFIRHELGNETVRIILRTGQPGQAPERRIVIDHDINDYKAKTELTADRLFTTLTAALRSYAQLERLEVARRELAEANALLEQRVAERTASLREANERLASRSAKLARANRLKSEMLGTIAHDLKNPLGIILGRMEMLDDLLALEPPPREAIRAQVEHVRGSARHMGRMIDALIADAMGDALDITLHRGPVDLAALAADVVASNRILAERKNQRIALAGPEHLMLTGDADRLREALDNLLSNAIKYSPPGTGIAVTLEREAGNAVCHVRDEGPGLSAEDEMRLFGRFQRLSAQPTGGESATGLGLFITRRIAQLHGGTVTARSGGPGHGSTFSLVLPLDNGIDTP